MEALNQAFSGLLLDLTIVQQAQFELNTLLSSKRHLLPEDTTDLLALPAILAEALRSSTLTSPVEAFYQIAGDKWYKKLFLTKGSIVVYDRAELLTDPMFSDEEVQFGDANSDVVSTGTLFGQALFS